MSDKALNEEELRVTIAQSNKSGSFKFEKRQGTHKASVIFQTRAFAPATHKITKGRDSQTIVDGRYADRTDSNVPNMEISSIKLFLDGTEVSIPRKLYSDCFEPSLDDRFFSYSLRAGFQERNHFNVGIRWRRWL